MPATPVIDVVSDADVALKCFHSEGEQEVDPPGRCSPVTARALSLRILDLTPYEVGNELPSCRGGGCWCWIRCWPPAASAVALSARSCSRSSAGPVTSSDLNALLDADWDTAAEPLAALGHPVRLAVLRGVLTGLHTTSELAALDRLGTTGQLYHHLRQLQAAGWLRSTGRGRYDVPATRVIPLLVIVTAAQP